MDVHTPGAEIEHAPSRETNDCPACAPTVRARHSDVVERRDDEAIQAL